VDEGLVVRSRSGEDDFNAIDPNLVIEDEKNVWLAWGSFWGGIMMRRIDPETGKLSTADTTLHSGITSSPGISAAAAREATTRLSSAARKR
jgi:arabinan endo-1,5-alpha-L-arabinosidase